MKNDIQKELNYLRVIAEEQNMTRAAKRLFVSQPALTSYLNRLEANLGVTLFDRSSTPIQITRVGAYYIGQLEKINIARQNLLDDLYHISNSSSVTLNIGIGRNRSGIWLPKVLPEMYKLYPDAQFHVTEDRDANSSQRVINGVLDVAVVETYAYHSLLEYLRLPEEIHLFIAGEGSALVRGADLRSNSIETPLAIDADLLSNEMFICPNVDRQLNIYTQWMYATYGFQPKKMLVISNDVTSYQLAVEGIGITFLNSAYSRLIRTQKKPVFIMPGGVPARKPLYAIYNGKNVTPPFVILLTFYAV